MRQVLGFHILHSFLFSAFLFSSAYDDSFRNSFSIPIVSFPLVFSYHPTLYHLPQKAFASEYMTNLIFLPSPDHIHKTSFFLYHSFVFMYLQLIFSIFLHAHISKASSLRISSFLYVHVSAA